MISRRARKHSVGQLPAALAMLLLLLAGWLGPATNAAAQAPGDPGLTGSVFVENVGQFDPAVRFAAVGGADSVRAEADGLWLTLLASNGPAASCPVPAGGCDPTPSTARAGAHLRLSYSGANPHPRIEGFDRQNTRVSYFRGSDPAGWRPDVPVWGGVRYVEYFPGVDLEVTAVGGQLQQRFVVRSGAGAAALQSARLQVAGATGLAAAGPATLQVGTVAGDLHLPLPGVTGAPAPEGGYSVSGAGVLRPFVVANADASVAAGTENSAHLFSTFLGGSGDDIGSGIKVAPNGDLVIAGSAFAADLPATPGAFDAQPAGFDAFVARLSAGGDRLVSATFFGGFDADRALALAVDSAGNSFLAGETRSTDLPVTTGAAQASFGSRDAAFSDAYVAKISPDGTTLRFATYYGGGDSDRALGVAVDVSGNVYLAGETHSTNLPLGSGGFLQSFGGYVDAFAAKISADGKRVVYGTYLGGSGWDAAEAIAVDAQGQAVIAGTTFSSGFPVTAGVHATARSGDIDGFVVKLASPGDLPVFATFLGGSGNDGASGVALDATANVYVTGWTTGVTPVGSPFQAVCAGGTDAYLAKLLANGAALSYLSCLGGRGNEGGRGVAVDGTGAAWVAGTTDSTDLPVSATAAQPVFGGFSDAFVARLRPGQNDPGYLSYLGADRQEHGLAVALDAAGNGYATGFTQSPAFPVTPGAYQRQIGGGQYPADSFVTGFKVAFIEASPGTQPDDPPVPRLFLPSLLRSAGGGW